MNALEKLLYGGQVMLIGLVIVFAVLTLLIIIISMLSAAIRRADEKKNVPAPAPVKAAPVPVVKQPEPAPVAEEVEEPAEDDAQLIAVIAAALAAYDNSGKLVVRSVRRVNGWKNANRSEQVYHF